MPGTDEIMSLQAAILGDIHTLFKPPHASQAGCWRTGAIFVGDKQVPYAGRDVPHLMQEFGDWLQQAPPSPATAFSAHLRLLDIHPFGDGNGRTSRLLMNTILLCGGYRPVIVRPTDKAHYVDTIEMFVENGDAGGFMAFMAECALTSWQDAAPSRPQARKVSGSSPDL